MNAHEIKELVKWLVMYAATDLIATMVFHAPGWAAFLGSATVAFIVVPSKA